MNSTAPNSAEHGPSPWLDLPEPQAWFGVHELTEFVFCPRAGLQCRRESLGDTGQELDRLPRLDYLPDFDVVEIRATLNELAQQMETFVIGTIIGGFCLFLVAAFINWIPAATIAAGYVFPLRWYLQQWNICRQLEQRLRDARSQPADEPPLPLTQQVRVNWWSLLKAGMTPVEYEEGHRDPTLCLSGRPWRVLQRGSLRIPVFRKRSGPPELHPQHFIRMTAYCHLVAECELAEVPYAIVLFGDDFDGIAIPNRPQDGQPFRDALQSARDVLLEFETQCKPPPLPEPTSACRNCHWGLPRRCDGEQNSTFQTKGRDEVLYHSPCGDLFGWVPPTERARQLGLSDGGA